MLLSVLCADFNTGSGFFGKWINEKAASVPKRL
jgi:hypothetical protein